MSGLWAFTGPPDGTLASRMGAALVHRSGGVMPTVVTGDRATVAVASRTAQLGGVVADAVRRCTIGFAGRLPVGLGLTELGARVAAGGPDALAGVGGEWIVAFHHGDRLIVARDPAGARTAYWGSHGGRILVAIEPKGVLAAPGFPRRIHPPAIAQFLAFSFVPGEGCALADLFEIPAGHRLEIECSTGRTRLVRWFCHEDITTEAGCAEHWTATTRGAVDAAVADRVPHGEPVATFLSGGLDSSLVTAAAAEVRRVRGEDPPTAWSLHFGARYPNEIAYAAEAAAVAGVEHRVIEVSPHVVADRLRRMVWHLDEPIGDPVTVGNFVLAAAASRETPWILNGEGGDPVFGGPKNLPMLLAHWYPSGGDPRFRERQYLATWRRAAEEVTELLHPDVLAEIDLERDLDAVVRPHLHAAAPQHLLNKLMVANMRLKGAHLILPKVDRMVGASGAVALSPLFDGDVLRLSLRMPPTAKLRDGTEKWVLKEAYRDLLPASVVDRPKSGMRVPVRWWFQREMKPLARELLSTSAVRRGGLLRPDRVREIRRYRTGRDGLRLWMLVTLELWRRIVVEGETP